MRTLTVEPGQDPAYDHWDGTTATPEQITESDRTVEGVILIAADDGEVCGPGTWDAEHRETIRVWVEL